MIIWVRDDEEAEEVGGQGREKQLQMDKERGGRGVSQGA